MISKFIRFAAQFVWPVLMLLFARYAWLTAFDFVGSEALAHAVAAIFIVATFFAGVPFAEATATRWTWRLRLVPKHERDRTRPYGMADMISIVKKEVPEYRFGLLRTGALVTACIVAVVILVLPTVKANVSRALPADISALLAYNPPVTTQVWSADGEMICEFTLEHRIKVPIEQIPKHVQQAFIAAEDKNFYTHHGVDLVAIVRAAIANHEGGAAKQGASTLTQQAVKQVVLKNSEKTLRRKAAEALLAVEMERRLSKDQILEVYLNHVFLGHGAYGVEAAAQTYFGKHVSELTVAEAALIAGLPKAPSHDSPYSHFDRAKVRQAYVLGRMADSGFITAAAETRAGAQPIAIVDRPDDLNRAVAPYFCDTVRRELTRLYGAETVFSKGLRVVTTLDMKMQRAAEASVKDGLIDLERRIGWNGPEGRDASYVGCPGPAETVAEGIIETGRIGLVTEDSAAVCIRGALYPLHPDDVARMFAWRKSTGSALVLGDLMSVQIRALPTAPATGSKRTFMRDVGVTRYALAARRTGSVEHPDALQAGLISIDPRSGEVKALVGGYDFHENQYNSVTQAHRQPGSSVKPYVYLTALMSGMTVDQTLVDRPVMVGNHLVQNYTSSTTRERYHGTVSLRKALALSLNSISIQLAQRVGTEEVIRTMDTLGINTEKFPRTAMIAIGIAEMTPWEHAYGIAQIASMGHEAPRHPGAKVAGSFLRRVEDSRGKVLLDMPRTMPDDRPQIVPAADAYALTYLMRGVVEEGTAKRVQELGWPAIGKTGTTNNFKDVWFEGCTPILCGTVWVGRMTPERPIVVLGEGEKADGATGGSVALPLWLAYMKAAHPTDVPPHDFPVPSDIVLVRVPSGQLVPYQRGRVPAKYLKGAAADTVASTAKF